MELQYFVDTWVPEPPPLTLTTMINIIKEVPDQGKIIDLKILILLMVMVEDQELIVMKVLNLAKQSREIGEGIRDMLQKSIKTRTSLEAVRHIGSPIATWPSKTRIKMTPTTCSSHFNLEMDLNLQFQFQLET